MQPLLNQKAKDNAAAKQNEKDKNELRKSSRQLNRPVYEIDEEIADEKQDKETRKRCYFQNVNANSSNSNSKNIPKLKIQNTNTTKYSSDTQNSSNAKHIIDSKHNTNLLIKFEFNTKSINNEFKKEGNESETGNKANNCNELISLKPQVPIFTTENNSDNIIKLNSKLKLKVSIPKDSKNEDSFSFGNNIFCVKSINEQIDMSNNQNMSLSNIQIKTPNLNQNNQNVYNFGKPIYSPFISQNNNIINNSKKETLLGNNFGNLGGYPNTAFSPISPSKAYRICSPLLQQSLAGTPNNQISFNFNNQNFYNNFHSSGINSKETYKDPATNPSNIFPNNASNNLNNFQNSDSSWVLNNINIFSVPQPPQTQSVPSGEQNLFQWAGQASPGIIYHNLNTTNNIKANNFSYPCFGNSSNVNNCSNNQK